MRWTALFEDLEAQLEAADQASLEAEVQDRTRREAGLLTLVDRLVPAVGQRLTVLVQGADPVRGVLTGAGADWLLLIGEHGSPAAELLIPLAGVLAVTAVGSEAQPSAAVDAVSRRLDLRWALRCLARNRSGVHVVLRDRTVLTGTLDQVGADYVELAEHPWGEPRRPAAVRQRRLVPVSALAVLRSS